MTSAIRRLLGPVLTSLLAHTPLQFWPVRIRHGFLRGNRWTLWPHSAYWRGDYEPEVQAALARNAPPLGGAAWDLGAHFGFYTLWLARAVGPAGQICAFEPDLVSFDRLRRHVTMNRLGHVQIFQCAVSDDTGNRLLIQSQGAGATTSHLPYQGETTAGQHTVAIQTVALDALAEKEAWRPPQFIKIDIEGHAASALRGAQRTLGRHHPVLLISLHSPQEVDGVRIELQPLGYQPYALDGARLDWSETLFKTVILKT
ncbi:FkbM family methyltransferase [Horticoccus luteus]|uniref:FkbM family methyltransferase n=1 Tax=Horticoccus luteus TaxID=2862869 RepID=A0A8F9XIK0_9BACT|nr:FkbM family methyltransferase [Horticoccus luteus]QYM80485.1 FkbM family methyltransferase [Horticoccus luteus]